MSQRKRRNPQCSKRLSRSTSQNPFLKLGFLTGLDMLRTAPSFPEPVVALSGETTPSTILMEACGSSHHWARQCRRFGHDVKLLPPSYVRPYVHRSKTDRADVKGMLEAWRNSDIRLVPVKTESQQQLTALHRVRSTWIGTRTARINAVRGTLREFGIVIPVGARRHVATHRFHRSNDCEVKT
jgi:transposase